MTEHSRSRTNAVKASGQPRSTGYRIMHDAKIGSPSNLFRDPEHVHRGPRRRRIQDDESQQWFLTAEYLLRRHAESKEKGTSFAEECDVPAEYEQELLDGLRQVAGQRIGNQFRFGKAGDLRYPNPPKQNRKRSLIELLARALDQLASKKPQRVQEAVESYASLVQADDRLIQK